MHSISEDDVDVSLCSVAWWFLSFSAIFSFIFIENHYIITQWLWWNPQSLHDHDYTVRQNHTRYSFLPLTRKLIGRIPYLQMRSGIVLESPPVGELTRIALIEIHLWQALKTLYIYTITKYWTHQVASKVVNFW